jgi:hypothetical protein
MPDPFTPELIGPSAYRVAVGRRINALTCCILHRDLGSRLPEPCRLIITDCFASWKDFAMRQANLLLSYPLEGCHPCVAAFFQAKIAAQVTRFPLTAHIPSRVFTKA